MIATGGRALWLTYIGGNIREWSLWTKGPQREGAANRLPDSRCRRPGARDPRGVWEGSLPYATGNKIVVLAPNGSRRFTLTAPDRVVSLSAHSRGYAAVLESGHVLTISLAGKLLREREFEPGFVQDAVLAAPGLIVKTPTALEIHNGDATRLIPLPQGSRFLGYSEGIAAYGIGRQLRLKRIANGKDDALPHARAALPGSARPARNRVRLESNARVHRLGPRGQLRLERRHLDLEQVAVETASDHDVAVLDELQLVRLRSRETRARWILLAATAQTSSSRFTASAR